MIIFGLFVLMLYNPVNNFSVMSGGFPVFFDGTSIKDRINSLAQGHNEVSQVNLKQATL